MQNKVVPVSIIRQKEREEKLQKLKTDFIQREVERKEKKKQAVFRKAEDYVREYREREAMERRLIEETKKKGDYYVSEGSKVLFVIRIKGLSKIPSDKRKTLCLLRLRKIHQGIFLKVNKSTMEMLKKVDCYVTYGEPTLENIRALVYRRGFVKMPNGDRIRITDNDIIEQCLGEHGIICVEDLIHELVTAGSHFREANRALWPFCLSSPLKGFGGKKKLRNFVEGGACGNREELINELIRKML